MIKSIILWFMLTGISYESFLFLFSFFNLKTKRNTTFREMPRTAKKCGFDNPISKKTVFGWSTGRKKILKFGKGFYFLKISKSLKIESTFFLLTNKKIDVSIALGTKSRWNYIHMQLHYTKKFANDQPADNSSGVILKYSTNRYQLLSYFCFVFFLI